MLEPEMTEQRNTTIGVTDVHIGKLNGLRELMLKTVADSGHSPTK
jgi:hypothetical protein